MLSWKLPKINAKFSLWKKIFQLYLSQWLMLFDPSVKQTKRAVFFWCFGWACFCGWGLAVRRGGVVALPSWVWHCSMLGSDSSSQVLVLVRPCFFGTLFLRLEFGVWPSLEVVSFSVSGSICWKRYPHAKGSGHFEARGRENSQGSGVHQIEEHFHAQDQSRGQSSWRVDKLQQKNWPHETCKRC